MQTGNTMQPNAAAHRRTLWRWHFYAALFVMPLLLVLAVTGTIYCFQPQIEPLLYADRMVVEPAATPRLAESALLAKAVASQPRGATPTTAQITGDPRRSAEFVFRQRSGASESVYVNPYTGAVLGTLSVEHRLMKQVRELHRGLMLGKTGELAMELAACWTLVMIGTGIALWWPAARRTGGAGGAARSRELGGTRGSRASGGLRGGVFVPRLSLRGRAWWRDLHLAGGIWLAAGALFFVLSGLPWSGNWGKQFKGLATSAQMGYPKGAWGEAHVHSSAPSQKPAAAPDHAGHAMKMDDLPLPQTPWAVGQTDVPQSAPDASRLSIDDVVAIAASQGVVSGYAIALPKTAQGVYTVSYFPGDPKAERTLHIDQYDGRILSDLAYDDYGAVAQWVSYGTSLHMGRYFGVANQLLAAAISLGLAMLAVSGFAMWWLRRPGRALGAPPRPAAPAPMRAWRGSLALLGVVFPLMGATMLLVWLGDRAVFSRRAAAAEAKS